jgi:transcriptional regulator with XRE-family HTH domain
MRKHPGDLGRRIERRRHELGLTRAQVARRARLTEGFIRYVEEQPAEMRPGTLWRLAAALETTPRRLLGAGLSSQGAETHPGEAGTTLGR